MNFGLLFVIIGLLLVFSAIILLSGFGRHARTLKFWMCYRLGLWSLFGLFTDSGSGSELQNTTVISNILPVLVKQYHIKSIIDCGCGDLNWISRVLNTDSMKLVKYTGVDLIMHENQKQYPQYVFLQKDIVVDQLPQHDLALVKDVFIHLSNAEISDCIQNLKRSNIKYVLVGTNRDSNNNQLLLHARTVDLAKSPFNLAPLEYFEGNDSEQAYTLFSLTR